MISMSTLYWFTRLDSFKDVLFGGGFIVLFIAFISFILAIADCEGIATEEVSKFEKMALIVSSIALLFSLLMFVSQAFIPSTKEMAFIYLAPKMVNNKDFQSIPSNAAKLLNLEMEKYIKGLSK